MAGKLILFYTKIKSKNCPLLNYIINLLLAKEPSYLKKAPNIPLLSLRA
jgi:hypothetical protein